MLNRKEQIDRFGLLFVQLIDRLRDRARREAFSVADRGAKEAHSDSAPHSRSKPRDTSDHASA